MNDSSFEKIMRQRLSSSSLSSAKTIKRSSSSSNGNGNGNGNESFNLKHDKIISNFYYHLNKKKKNFPYNPEKRLFENLNFKNKSQKPYVKILTESQYYEKMIISELIEEFNIDYFFSKMKDKIFVDTKKYEKVINKQLFKDKENFRFSIKGGNNLKSSGDNLLKILHIFDAKHDFDKYKSIKTYIDDMYENYIASSSFSQTEIELFNSLYERNGVNYEEMILQYILIHNKDIFDNVDDNANVIYVDVNTDATKFEYFSKENKDKKRDGYDIAADDQETVYNALINIIKNFYDFKETPDKYGYMFDTNISSVKYDGLGETYHNIKEGVFDKISTQLLPFENAYDPHSSTDIVIEDVEFDVYNQITNLNFNTEIFGEEYKNAIRDLTRRYFNFTTKKIDNIYFPNIKFNICDIASLNDKIDRISVLSIDNRNIMKSIFSIDKLSNLTPNFKHPKFKKLIFNLDARENKINITYEKSFNSIDMLKTFIEKFIKFQDELEAYTNLMQEAQSIVSTDKSELWLLFLLVMYLMVSIEQTTFLNKKKEIISILLDFKKSGDWGQSLFCSKYNDVNPAKKEAYFISGDKLSAARAILNGNVKTMTATDYNILEMNITDIKYVDIIKNKKKSILTLYNGKNKFKFNDLYKLIEGSIFEFYAFNDIDDGKKLFNFDEMIFDNFKKVSGVTNDTIIDNTNFNFDYFWYFMIVIIYQIRTYIDTYNVFKIIGDNFEILSYNKDRLTFDYKKLYQDGLSSALSIPLAMPPANFYRNFADEDDKYKIMQLNENIFRYNNRNVLTSYLKLIDNNRTHFYNGDLDKKYLSDIVNILKEIFGNTIIPEYNYGGTNRFCEYLNGVYTNILSTIPQNYDNFIKFFRKFAKLITLCQILYIDNITKEEGITFNKIHSTILTTQHEPKTVCKIIIDKFYNDICILYENFQASTERIGDDVYLNALENIILSYSSFEDRIKYIDDELLYPLENLKFKLNILDNLIKKHNLTSPNKLNRIIDDQDQYTILLSLYSHDFITKDQINIIDDDPDNPRIRDIQMKFDRFNDIYKKTYEKIPGIELNDANVSSDLDKELLKNYYNTFLYSDIEGFFKQIQLLRTSLLENEKFFRRFQNIIKDIQQNVVFKQLNIQILIDISGNLSNDLLLANIEELERSKDNLPIFKRLCQKFLTYFNEQIIIPFKTIYEAYKSITKQDRLKSILLKLEDNFDTLSNSLLKKIDDKLYEYFNSCVLSCYVLKDYIGIPTISNELLEDIQKSYIEAVKPIEIRKVFKDTATTLDDVYYEIIKERDNLKEKLQIEKLNIEKIYDFDKSLGTRRLKVPESFLKKSIFFYPVLKDIVAANPTAVVKTGDRMRSANSRFLTTAPKKIKVDDKLQLKNWHINSKSYNQIYKILTKNDTLEVSEIIVSNETLSEIFNGIFKNKDVKTFIKPEIEVDMTNDEGNIDKFFLNTGFILMVSKILEKTMNTYTSIIKNITTFDNTLNINSFLTKEKNYYNDDKYKIITIIGSYTKFMLAKKIAYLNENSKKYGIYRFDKLFRTKIFPNSTSKIDSICSILDTLMIFTKSKFLVDAKDEYFVNSYSANMDDYLKSMNVQKLYFDTNEKISMHDKKYPYYVDLMDELTTSLKSIKISQNPSTGIARERPSTGIAKGRLNSRNKKNSAQIVKTDKEILKDARQEQERKEAVKQAAARQNQERQAAAAKVELDRLAKAEADAKAKQEFERRNVVRQKAAREEEQRQAAARQSQQAQPQQAQSQQAQPRAAQSQPAQPRPKRQRTKQSSLAAAAIIPNPLPDNGNPKRQKTKQSLQPAAPPAAAPPAAPPAAAPPAARRSNRKPIPNSKFDDYVKK